MPRITIVFLLPDSEILKYEQELLEELRAEEEKFGATPGSKSVADAIFVIKQQMSYVQTQITKRNLKGAQPAKTQE